MEYTKKEYPIDHSAILYLAQMGPDHTNVYRFTARLTESVCPFFLETASTGIYTRFPTIFAGFRPGFFHYTMVPALQAPRVEEDPGLLKTMLPAEMRSCAYRIYYKDNSISIEAFHALADGYGAIISLRALVSEYLFQHYGLDTPERQELLEKGEPDWETELQDAYLDAAGERSAGASGRYSYQLPGEERDGQIRFAVEAYPTRSLLNAAKRNGVSMTAMLSCLMAEAIMTIQQSRDNRGRKKPVRIMIPIDLRKAFPSRTLRNFILYALPGLEADEMALSREHRMERFHQQIRQQTTREHLAPQIARNVNIQRSPLFRMIPLGIKCAAMRLAYRFLGESNSSITLTNLGAVSMSESMRAHVQSIQVFLTPRRNSPYNCSMISCGDQTYIAVTRFCPSTELEDLFFRKLHSITEA